MKVSVVLLLCAIFPGLSLAAEKHPLVRVPALRAGQKFVYRVHFQEAKSTRSESRIATAALPAGQSSDLERWVSVEVKNIGSAGVALHTQVLPADGAAITDSTTGVVDLTLQPDGRGSEVRGLDTLPGDEQTLWREWLAQFALGWTFPERGIKAGEKWRKEEPVVGAAVDRLVWEKQYEYVRDELCPERGDGGAGKSAGLCAVVVTTTAMKQHGPKDDTTPGEYQVHQLKTSGTASGKSQVITYISLQSGFVERATEESAQVLDVLIAKADDSNKAHFNVDATSRTEVVLLH
jgi:hypothetical protein